MNDVEFDAKLGQAARSLVTVRVVHDPLLEANERSRKAGVDLFLVLVAVVVLAAAVSVGPRLGPEGGAAVDVSAGRLTATSGANTVTITLRQQDGTDEQLVTVPVRAAITVRELLCQIRLSDRRLILFGQAPINDPISVALDGDAVLGELARGPNGEFIFLSDDAVRPGPEWVVSVSGTTTSGHIPGVGSRTTGQVDPNYCFAYDSGSEGQK